jgi:hypothetical protein
MKTQINLSNLKRMTATVIAFLLLTSSGYLNAGQGSKDVATEMVRLEAFVSNIEGSLKYSVTEFTENEEVATAIERLEMLALVTEASLKYSTPVSNESEITTPELESLEMLAAATEALLKYNAPVSEGINPDESQPEDTTEITLAENTK